MALLKLVTFIEEQFGVTVGDGDLVPDNLETINHIKAFVEMRQ
jgi:acyl carrier protein